MIDCSDGADDLGEQRLVTRAIAVILANRANDVFFVLANETLQRQQIRLALGIAWHRMLEVGLSLQCQCALQVGDDTVDVDQVFNRVSAHKILLR